MVLRRIVVVLAAEDRDAREGRAVDRIVSNQSCGIVGNRGQHLVVAAQCVLAEQLEMQLHERWLGYPGAGDCGEVGGDFFESMVGLSWSQQRRRNRSTGASPFRGPGRECSSTGKAGVRQS